MKYLDYSVMPKVIKTYFDSEGAAPSRRVGVGRCHESGYSDIVRFFGDNAPDPGKIDMEFLPNGFEFDDALIAEFAARIAERMHTEGRLYDGPPAMRVADFEFSRGRGHMIVQPCRYEAQAGSCFALDLPDPNFAQRGGTLRNYYLSEYPSRRLADNPLALCLGVCGLVLVRETSDDYLLTVHRAPHLASLENSTGPSVAGSVDFDSHPGSLEDTCRRALAIEAHEELGLTGDDYKLVPLAYAREIFRGEKPQLFFLLETSLSRARISEMLNENMTERAEFDAFDFVGFAKRAKNADSWLENLNHEARMNYFLAEEYLGSSR